jgi:hypothetical protein
MLTYINSLNGRNREPDYQIMVFCTSVEGAANPPALMEFPHVCEIKMSGRVLEAVSLSFKETSGSKKWI